MVSAQSCCSKLGGAELKLIQTQWDLNLSALLLPSASSRHLLSFSLAHSYKQETSSQNDTSSLSISLSSYWRVNTCLFNLIAGHLKGLREINRKESSSHITLKEHVTLFYEVRYLFHTTSIPSEPVEVVLSVFHVWCIAVDDRSFSKREYHNP